MHSRRKDIKKDDTAQVGIGTMIVFIATVLVAAIAAGVLITTSSDLQEKSSRTGKEATEQVASNFQVQSVYGSRALVTDDIQEFQIYLTLSPGATQVDLSQLRIQVTDGSTLSTLSYVADGAAPAAGFSAVEVRDVDSSFDTAATPDQAVMTSGDLVYLRIDPTNAAVLNAEVAPRSDLSFSLIPEVGNSVDFGFITPTSYGTDLVVELL